MATCICKENARIVDQLRKWHKKVQFSPCPKHGKREPKIIVFKNR